MVELPVQVILRDDDLRRSRLTVFFRALLALPHLVWLGIWGTFALFLSPIMWIATLISGRPPRELHDFYSQFVRYSLHVLAYLYLATDKFPEFTGDRGRYAIDVDIEPPQRQNRWAVAFRFVLAVPALLLASALGAGLGGGGARSFSWNIGVLAGVGILAWFACLVRGRMPRGFRDLMVYALHYEAQTYAYLFFLTGRYPNSNPAASPAAELPEHPVALSVAGDDLRRSRLTVFFRLLLFLPHLVWLLLWGIAVFFAAIGAWFAALFTARVPGALHRFLAAYLRYSTHVFAFVYLAGNPFPGFTGAPGSYPVDLRVAGPERQSRWAVLFRLLLAFPAFVVAATLGTLQSTATILGWFAALFTGRMPEGLRNVVAYTLRYSVQYYAYTLLLTPRYPYSGPGPRDRPSAETLAEAA
jgi:hypothetical protein